jgi:glycosyltransferase involved in cell wall biosynthesis
VDELEPERLEDPDELSDPDRLVDDLEDVRMLLPEPAQVNGMGRARDQEARRAEEPRDPLQERRPLARRHVLEHVEERHEVERPLELDVLEPACVELRFRHEVARELDRRLAEVEPGDAAEPGQPLREDARAATDVEDAEVVRAVQELGHDEVELLVPEVRDEPVADAHLEGESLVEAGSPRARHGAERSAETGEPRLRVAVVTEWFPEPHRPIWGTFVAEHARALATRHDVTVVAPSDGKPDRRLWRVDAGEELGLATRRVRNRGRWTKLAGTVEALRELEPQIIHAHVFGPGAAALVARRFLGVPVVVSEHESRVARGLLSFGERRVARSVYRRADVVCPVSADLGRRIAALAPRARIEVLPNPVDTKIFSPRPLPTGAPPLALAVSSLVEVKDVPLLLEALAQVRARGRELVLDVVGDGPDREACTARARELGLEDAVRFRGTLGRVEVADAIAHCRFLCLSSRWENLPVSALEALAVGRPVVATDVGGVSEAVGPADGILVPPRDAGGLADAMEAALDRVWEPAELAARAAARFSHAAIAERATEIYAAALARR